MIIQTITRFTAAILRTLTAIINGIIFWQQKVRFDNRPLIRGVLFVQNRGEIRIGKNVVINSSLASNPVFGSSRTVLVTARNARISIGDNTGLSNAVLCSHTEIRIGKNVFVGAGAKLFDTDFHSIESEVRLADINDRGISKAIDIGNNVLLGAGCLILKGVKVGDCSVVGAGAVVTRDIPPFQIWAGNPARFIRTIVPR